MKKLVLNVIVLGVFGSTVVLSSCNLFGSKEKNVDPTTTNDTIVTLKENEVVDSINKDSILIKESTTIKEEPVKVEIKETEKK